MSKSNKEISLPTAKCNHLECFICGRKKERLYKTPSTSIAYAYVVLRIVIKPDARICCRHFDEKREIKKEDFQKIKLKEKNYSSNYVKFFDELGKFVKFSQPGAIFEPFKNLNTLDEAHCKKITNFSKEQFIRLSSFIKSFKKSDGRDKNEIIALYIYSLRKGVTQATLAYFKEDSSQRDISRYLEQMRNCLIKDFVPNFLGAALQTREFYVNNGSVTCKTIYDLEDDCLALICDG